MLDAVAVVPDGVDEAGVGAALLALVAVVRPLLGGDGHRLVPGAAPGTCVAFGTGSRAVSLAVVTSTGHSGLELDLVGAQRNWRLELPDDGTARPASAVLQDADGGRSWRPVHESARRATWRELHAELTTAGSGRHHTLADLVEDLRTVAEIRP